MKTIVLVLLLLGFSGCAAFVDDSHPVQLGSRTAFYIVRPCSAMIQQLDLFDAPWIDTADRMRHGYGADVLAFRFNSAGILTAPPAYIVQGPANEFYTRRLAAFVPNKSTAREVEAMFGRGFSLARRPNGLIYYYTLPVYNPAEDWSSRR